MRAAAAVTRRLQLLVRRGLGAENTDHTSCGEPAVAATATRSESGCHRSSNYHGRKQRTYCTALVRPTKTLSPTLPKSRKGARRECPELPIRVALESLRVASACF